jgi:hypothetical protein
MKTGILIGALALGTASGLAQGTINFNNNIPGVTVSRVYWGYGPVKHGNSSTDYPRSGLDWSGYWPLDAPWWSAQLYAAPEANENPVALMPAYPITTFRTGAEAGFVNAVIATLSGVPADAPVATVQLRVWDNDNGAWPTWEAAVAADSTRGASLPFTVYNIGGAVNPPPSLYPLQSFSVAVLVPEPGSGALLGLGGTLWWLALRRRRLLRGCHPAL